jgi:peptidoglycan/LPS O-acetylase OafA/YrhL
MTTAYVQLISLVLASLALLLGGYLLIIGKRPWRGGESIEVAPRVRLLGVSYILVFGAAMVQIIVQPTGTDAEALGALMVLGGLIVIVVVYLEARASRRASHEDRLDSRLRG